MQAKWGGVQCRKQLSSVTGHHAKVKALVPMPCSCPCRLYRPSSYYAAKFLVGLPFAVFNILTLVFIVYGMVGFRCGQKNVSEKSVGTFRSPLFGGTICATKATCAPPHTACMLMPSHPCECPSRPSPLHTPLGFPTQAAWGPHGFGVGPAPGGACCYRHTELPGGQPGVGGDRGGGEGGEGGREMY